MIAVRTLAAAAILSFAAVSGCMAGAKDNQFLVAAFDPPNSGLIEAVCHGNVGEIDNAIRAGADINAIGRGGYTPIYAALECDQASAVIALLDRGLDPNVRLPEMSARRWDPGFTPIIIAADISGEGVLRALLSRGADPNAVKEPTIRDGGSTALYQAIASRNWANFDVLLEHGADLHRLTRPHGLDAFELLGSRGDYCVLFRLSPQMRAENFASVLPPVSYNDQNPDEAAAETRCKHEFIPLALRRTTLDDLIAYMRARAGTPLPEEIAQAPELFTEEATNAWLRERAQTTRTYLESHYLQGN